MKEQFQLIYWYKYLKDFNTLLFVNRETFSAIGVSQSDYYDVLMKRILSNGVSRVNILECIELLEILKDPYELS